MKKLWVAILILGFPAGCYRSSPLPFPETSDMEIPSAWREQPAAIETPAEVWWHVPGDPHLDEIIREVLQKNKDIEAAMARMEAAYAQARAAGAVLWPGLTGEGSAGRAHQSTDMGIPLPGSDSSRVEMTTSQFGVSLNVSWELDIWGRLRNMRNAAVALAKAGRADFEGVRLSMAGQAMKLYFALREAGKQVDLTARIVKVNRLALDLVKQRYRSGLLPSERVREANNAWISSQVEHSIQENKYKTLIRQLEILMGRYPEGSLEIEKGIEIGPPDVSAGIPSDVLSRRPDLQAARERLLAADADLKAAHAALLPSIRLTGNAGVSSDSLSDLVRGDFSVWNLAAGLMQPIFEGGRLMAEIDISDAHRRELLSRYVSSVLKACADVENKLNALEHARHDTSRTAEIDQTNAARLYDTRRRYRSGRADALSVLISLQEKLSSERRLLTTRRQCWDAWIDVNLALGSGIGNGGVKGE